MTTKATFDTNIFPIDDLIDLMSNKNIKYTTTTTVMRELEKSKLFPQIKSEIIIESGVWGESRYGQSKYGPVLFETAVIGESLLSNCVLASEKDVDVLETLLKIISSNTFPKRGNRNNLTIGFRHHLRDAMILSAHIREGRDIFVTNDLKGFIKNKSVV